MNKKLIEDFASLAVGGCRNSQNKEEIISLIKAFSCRRLSAMEPTSNKKRFAEQTLEEIELKKSKLTPENTKVITFECIFLLLVDCEMKANLNYDHFLTIRLFSHSNVSHFI